jgi:hypothetical protein
VPGGATSGQTADFTIDMTATLATIDAVISESRTA